MRMKERKIAVSWLEQALEVPGRREQDELDPGLEHRLVVIAEHGDRVLRVVCDPHADPLRVVTLYFDRSLKGTL